MGNYKRSWFDKYFGYFCFLLIIIYFFVFWYGQNEKPIGLTIEQQIWILEHQDIKLLEESIKYDSKVIYLSMDDSINYDSINYYFKLSNLKWLKREENLKKLEILNEIQDSIKNYPK